MCAHPQAPAAANHTIAIHQLLAGLALPHKLAGTANSMAAVHAAYLDLAARFLPPHFIYSHLNDAATTERVCGLLLANGTRVALVGNGPLSEHDRAAIDAAPTVVRFNLMDNVRAGERTTVWGINDVVHAAVYLKRRKWAPGAGTVLLFCNTRIEAAQLKGHMAAAEQQLGACGPRAAFVRNNWDIPFTQRVGELLNLRGTKVTVGFRTLNLVLHCLPPEGRVDLFGFSFTVRPDTFTRGIHNGGMEAAVVRLAQHLLPDRLSIHETPCAAFRSCPGLPPEEAVR